MQNRLQFSKRALIVFSIAIGALAILAALSPPLEAHGWKVPDEAARRQNPFAEDPESAKRGQDLYGKYCAVCHGLDGRGGGPMASSIKPRPANLKKRAGHHSDGDFAWKIANGRKTMPPFKDQLTEDQIWDLVGFIQSLKKNP